MSHEKQGKTEELSQIGGDKKRGPLNAMRGPGLDPGTEKEHYAKADNI